MKKTTVKLTACGIFAALSTAIMLSSYFPFLTYAIPAIAGVILMVPTLECGIKYGFLSYVVTSFLAFLTAETEAKILFIGFFGLYPILKLLFERIKNRVLSIVLKFLSFNLLVFSSYFVIINLFGMKEVLDSFDIKNSFIAIIYLIGSNLIFLLYDIGISQMIGRYFEGLHHIVRKILRLN